MWLHHSLVKEPPLTKACPPTFGPISCIESKFTWMSVHPRASFMWSLIKHNLKRYANLTKKLHVILHQRKGIFAYTDVANAVHTASTTTLTVTWCRSKCCVSSGLKFEATGGYIVHYCFLNYLLRAHRVCCKHDMGALSWWKWKHSKEHLAPSLADL